MRRTLLVLLLIASFLLLSSCASRQAGSRYDQMKQAGRMVVGTSADFAPFEYIDENGTLTGFDIDLIREIGKRLGLEVQIEDMPFDSLLAAVQEGKIDLIIAGMNYTEERDKSVDFTDPYYASETVLLVQENFNESLTTSEDVVKYRIGTQIGTTADTWITDELINTGMMPDGQLSRYERPEQGALDLQAGRIDAYAIDDIPAANIAREMGGLKIIRLNEESLEEKPMNIVVPEGDADLAEAINDVLADLKEEGFLSQLEEKYIFSAGQ